MITLRVWRDVDGNVVRYGLDGHSPSGERGSNIGCDAESALAIAAANGIEAVAGARAASTSRSGHLSCDIAWPASPDAEVVRLKAQAILETMVLGMRSIADEHPHDLRVIEEQLTVK